MSYCGLLVRREGHIAIVALNRPEESNAIDQALAQELGVAFREVEADDGVRAIVLTGSGPVFSSGPLLEAPRAVSPDVVREFFAGSRCAEAVARATKPVVGAINGPATGQGLELALACDIRVASARATFAMTHLAHGLVPWDGGTQRLTRVVGRPRALEMLLTGREVRAEEAMAWGLVNEVVGADELMAMALERAQSICHGAPIAVRYAKEALVKGADLPLVEGLRLEADLAILLHTTADRAEGIRSFLDKRSPRFTGA
ncbi:MAG: enoyl-CoA hydratase/isomerase family protein [Chloroflexi bacterium]|nr:enoyl-CoA hydratase/isomerase family protein [Chloroflexota bacterium]